ncbi:MAG TPA: hypothetical protein VFK19_13775 [Sphingomicrobium sp.]|nr:hypothetical protein [Sphingomicrobium sp.]
MGEIDMLGRLATLFILIAAALTAPSSAEQRSGHYLFVLSGDQKSAGKDFLAVIDADPASSTYGRLVTSVATDQVSVRPHHTEYEMPASGMLFANDFDSGRTFIFDLRDPLHPKVATEFSDLDGFAFPHSFVRLPNGHVLATFQYKSGAMPMHGNMMDGATERSGAITGGLVEIDESGHAIRAAGSTDAALPGAALQPYSLAVLPNIDRVLVSNSPMQNDGLLRSNTAQLWRLSDLKLLKTFRLDPGEQLYAHLSPEEVRVGPDGVAYIQTLACGLERVTGMDSDQPKAQLVYTFPGSWCGVPTFAGHYLIESVPDIHGFIVLDMTDGVHPREASRLVISPDYAAHWTGLDRKTGRIVITSERAGDRTYLLKLDPATGALSIDAAFRGEDGLPGFSFAERKWPHGWIGAGRPHGAVFSR